VEKPGQISNGKGAGTPQAQARPRPGAATAKIRPRDARQARLAQAFAQVVAVLMRDANFRQMRLADLEHLVLPAIMAGQYRLAQVPARQGGARRQGQPQEGGVLVPVAVALWARVSATIDKRFSEGLDKPMQLGVGDWASGDNVWLMAVAGDRRAIPKFVDQLAATEFKGQRVKMRVRGPDNTVVVKALGHSASA
jgi:hemolysin-activating ACP:hemolysin acyltransferase